MKLEPSNLESKDVMLRLKYVSIERLRELAKEYGCYRGTEPSISLLLNQIGLNILTIAKVQ